MQDLWLRAEYPIGPFAQAPVDQAVADVLAKAPWSAWSTGEVPFRLELVDRPEAGTAFLALLHPSQQRPTSVPPDGLRYLVAEPNERRTLSRHAVSCPTSLANPTQHQSIQVELECLTSACGHLPPLSPEHPPSSSSPPELRLTRFRKRWRITNGQNPTLWFFWWGRDESGGMGQGSAPQAPPGWTTTPVRQYPLQRPPNAPTQPLFPFPSPSRMPPGAASAAPAGAAPSPAPPPPHGGVATAPPPPGTPQTRTPFAQFQPPPGPGGVGVGVGTPQQQAALAAASAATPYARQQQLAQLVANANQAQGASGVGPAGGGGGALAGGGANAALEARQAQYQQQQQQAAAAAAAAAAGRGAPPPVLGSGGAGAYAGAQQPSQLQAQQQQQQQQQAYLIAQQRAHAQAQAQAQAQAHAQASQPQQQRRPTMPASAASSRLGAAGAAHAPPPAPLAYDDTLFTDVLDLVSPRQLALHRLSTAHDLVQPLFDSAWTARDVLGGAPRTRDMLEVLGTVGVSRTTGEVRPGGARAVVPGFGRDGPLGECANAAARIAVRGAMGVEPGEAAKGGVEERRRRLEGLLRETEEGIERMEELHEVRMGRRGTTAAALA
ncbi:hypothetical protein JCM8208_001967 [Rhodotorula glutinis]